MANKLYAKHVQNEMYDYAAWDAYPHHRWIFNKLELAQRLGYRCAPAGVPVTQSAEYIIRPIYNLNGMGLGARIEWIEKDTFHDIEPGYFWCELFKGKQYSINYNWNDNIFTPTHASVGYNNSDNLTEFYRWEKIDPPVVKLPDFIDSLNDVENINIEFIDNKIIEIHLRSGIDFPPGAIEIIPVWKNTQSVVAQQHIGWKYIEDYEDCDNQLTNPRLGFYYK